MRLLNLKRWLHKSSHQNFKDKTVRYTRSGLSLVGLLLPNVKLFRMLNRQEDLILKASKITAGLSREFEVIQGGNKKVNRYLEKVWNKLHVYAQQKDKKKFEFLAKTIMERSSVIRVLFLYKVMPRWFIELSVSRLAKTLFKMARIMRNNSTMFEFKRIMIPKPDGTKRPLAVPPIEWRAIARFQYTLLKIWMSGRKQSITPPNFGVSTPGAKGAWATILQNLEKKYIYEFDIRKFFDSIGWNSIYSSLKSLRYPISLINWIISTLTAASACLKNTALREKREILESGTELERLNLWQGYIEGHEYTLKWMEDLIDNYKDPKVREIMKPKSEVELLALELWLDKLLKHGPMKTIRKLTEFRPEIEAKIVGWLDSQYKENKTIHSWLASETPETMEHWSYDQTPFYSGVPQGYGLSPQLACLGLKPLYDYYGADLIMYIDDGIIMTDDPFKIDELNNLLSKCSLTTKKEKTRWIKYNGEWEASIKFLGIEYLPETETLKGNTKNGSEVEIPILDFDKIELLPISEYTKVYVKSLSKYPNWERWIKIGRWGMAFAMMYNSPKIKPESIKIYPKDSSLSGINFKRDIHLNRTNYSSHYIQQTLDLASLTKRKTSNIREILKDLRSGRLDHIVKP